MTSDKLKLWAFRIAFVAALLLCAISIEGESVAAAVFWGAATVILFLLTYAREN